MATPILALDLFNKLQYPGRNNCISFGCRMLDEKIGGISFQGITEISGEAGCGKTQLCLILSLQIQLDYFCGGRSGSVAYLSCCEGLFPIRRLSQLAMAYEKKTNISNQVFLSNVHIEQCYNVDDVKTILKYRVPELCRTSNVKLLVIDSLAGLIRQEYDNRNMHEIKLRTEFMFNLAQQLKLISDIFRICVIVVNQVKASGFDSLECGNTNPPISMTVPALGLAWSHCINCRISLTRDTSHLRHTASTNTSMIDDDRNDYDAISLQDNNNKHDNNKIDCHLIYNDTIETLNKENISTQDSSLHNTRLLFHESIQYYSNNNNNNNMLEDESVDMKETFNKYNNNNNIVRSKDIKINSKSKRKMKLEFSPCHPDNECYYEITENGVYGIL